MSYPFLRVIYDFYNVFGIHAVSVRISLDFRKGYAIQKNIVETVN